jgi:5-methylcytosine-specific restriction endonuclease McrA
VKPLDAERSRYHLTVSRRFLAKLEAAKDALSHAMPLASSEEILEAGLDRLLADQAKRRGFVKKPRKSPPPSRTDHVPAHVRREVWARSGGRCEWVLESGERCGSTKRVEVDHVDPKALGGPPTIENTRALCRGHNLLAAREVFGDQWMDRYTRGGSSPPRRDGPPGPSGDQAGPP